MPIASVRQFIELAVKRPAQRPARGTRGVLELAQLVLGHLAGLDLAHSREDRVEIDVLALELAGEHRAAADDDGRDVEPGGSHEHAGDDLVAVGDHDHRVEGVRLDGQLDAVGDDLAARKRVAHPLVVHGDAVAHADGGELERRAAGHVDAGLDRVGDLVEHEVPGNDVVDGVDDGDQRPRDLLVGETVSLEQAAVRGLGGPVLHVLASQHRPPSPRLRGGDRSCRPYEPQAGHVADDGCEVNLPQKPKRPRNACSRPRRDESITPAVPPRLMSATAGILPRL